MVCMVAGKCGRPKLRAAVEQKTPVLLLLLRRGLSREERVAVIVVVVHVVGIILQNNGFAVIWTNYPKI